MTANITKIPNVQECKHCSSTVEGDLERLKDAMTELEEELICGDFDADEIWQRCAEVEELAKAIAKGVTNIPADCK